MNQLDTFYKQKRIIKYSLIIIFLSSLSFFTSRALSYSSGKTGHTATNSDGCNCHGNTANTNLTLSLSGPTNVTPGSTNDYTLTFSQSLGQSIAGINIAARQSVNGTVISGLSTSDTYMQLIGNELTHRGSPNQKAFSLGTATFTFSFTAPATPGTYYIQAIGNAVNGNGSTTGDYWNFLNPVAITVSAPNSSITLTSPTGGQNWCQGSQYLITWQSNNVTDVKIELSTDGGNTFPTTIVNSTPASIGSYQWTIPSSISSSNCKIKVSNVANIAVNSISSSSFSISGPTTITQQPQSLSVCQNSNATFTITATGSNLTYVWKKGDQILPQFNSNQLQLTNVVTADEGNYSCTVTGSCGAPQTSNIATLTVKTPPVITQQPQAVEVCVGEPATFRVTATGTNLSYNWFKNGAPIAGNGNIFMIPAVTPADSGIYMVTVVGDCSPSANSVPVKLTVVPNTSIKSQTSGPVNVCLGQKLELSVEVVGGNPEFTWKRNGLPVADQKSAKLVIQSTGTIDDGVYTCQIIGKCGTPVNSAPILVSIIKQISIKEQPKSKIAFIGDTIEFSVVTENGGNLSYQWRKNNQNLKNQTQSTLKLENLTKLDEGGYDCLVTAQCGGLVTTDIANLTVKERVSGPEITLNSQKISLDTVSLKSEAKNITFKKFITNTGGSDLIISDIKITGSDAESFVLTSNKNMIIKPKETADLSLRYLPLKAGINKANMEIKTNTTTNPNVEIELFGADLKIIPQSNTIDFGNVLIDTKSQNKIIIRNSSNIPVKLNSISFNGSDAQSFATDNSINYPITINIDEQKSFDIIFEPKENRNYEAFANLDFMYSDIPISILLKGSVITSVEEIANTNTLIARPNPSSEFTSIIIDDSKIFVKINYFIYDINGILRFSGSAINTNEIKWNWIDNSQKKCESGSYRIMINADGNLYNIPIVLEK